MNWKIKRDSLVTFIIIYIVRAPSLLPIYAIMLTVAGVLGRIPKLGSSFFCAPPWIHLRVEYTNKLTTFFCCVRKYAVALAGNTAVVSAQSAVALRTRTIPFHSFSLYIISISFLFWFANECAAHVGNSNNNNKIASIIVVHVSWVLSLKASLTQTVVCRDLIKIMRSALLKYVL